MLCHINIINLRYLNESIYTVNGKLKQLFYYKPKDIKRILKIASDTLGDKIQQRLSQRLD